METTGLEPVNPSPEGLEPAPIESDPKVPKTYDEDYVKKLRQEAANYRTKLSAFEKADEDRRQASLSEQQKATEHAEAAEKALHATQERLNRASVLMHAQARGAVDADAVYALLDKSAIDFSDDSKIAEAVESLLTQKTYLVKQGEKPAPAPRITPPTTSRDQKPYWAGRGTRL